ncbi:glycosyltransferase [Pleomorphomonas sp. JP5]|uniref:glycosyltransferase n=1 Tax=Pleomorphomonas sp. JP5 TaxID=2942998 RepID=UPI002042E9FB|nr:glycosyltransferase [Pleomorphomonas sp. JP5]MCM5559385.1 glycosyltransferase [Pleomorphomonas sp. JP5]
MSQFAAWLEAALTSEFSCKVFKCPCMLYNRKTRNLVFAKYLYYFDQFIIATIYIFVAQFFVSLVVVADHSNAPAAMLVAKRKLVIMLHDTIGMRRAFGLLPGYPRTGGLGRQLQRWTIYCLKRARLIMTNPGPLVEEMLLFGIVAPASYVGCVFDADRMLGEESVCPLAELQSKEFALFVGLDVAHKRQKQLIRTWSEINRARGREILLIMAGESSEETREYADEIEARNVRFLRHLPNSSIRWLYENCLLFSTASEYEGFGLPILEAIAFNKPVFVSSETPFFRQLFGKCVRSVIDFNHPNIQELLPLIGTPNDEHYREERDRILREYSFENFKKRVLTAVDIALSDESVRNRE